MSDHRRRATDRADLNDEHAAVRDQILGQIPSLLHDALDPIRHDVGRVTEKVDTLTRDVGELVGVQRMMHKQVTENAKLASSLTERVAKVEVRAGINGRGLMGAIADVIRRPYTVVLITAIITTGLVIAVVYGSLDLTELARAANR